VKVQAVGDLGLIVPRSDTAFAWACNIYGPVTVAAAAEIVFVAPARVGDVLTAEAVVRTRFGRAPDGFI
jgi:acyl-CoA thioesterase